MGMDVFLNKGIFVTAEEFVLLITDDNRETFVNRFKTHPDAERLNDCTDLDATRSCAMVFIARGSLSDDIQAFEDMKSWLRECHPELPSLNEIGYVLKDVAVYGDDYVPIETDFFVFSIEESIIQTSTIAGQKLAEKTGAKVTTSNAISASRSNVFLTKGIFVTAEEFVLLITDDNRETFVNRFKTHPDAERLNDCIDLDATRSCAMAFIVRGSLSDDIQAFEDMKSWLRECHPELPSLNEIGYVEQHVAVYGDDYVPIETDFLVFSIEESIIQTSEAAGQKLTEKTGAKVTTSVAVSTSC
jgi:hypothetical protein